MLIAVKAVRSVSFVLVFFLLACSEDDADPAATANRAPTISGIPSTSVSRNAPYVFAPTATDADGDALLFGIDGKPGWASFNPSNGQVSGTPTASDVGVYRGIVVWVSDGTNQTLLPAFDLTVVGDAPANPAPTISGSPATSVVAGTMYSFTPTASDPNGDPLSFTIRNRPTWATFTPTNGRLQGTPPAAGSGRYADIAISVSDGTTTVALAPFSIAVALAAANTAPEILGDPMTSVEAGSAYAFVPTANDPDGDSLAFGIGGLPPWASFDTATGALTGTPPAAGTFANVVISVSDGKASAMLAPFSITVTAAASNTRPQISGTPATTATQGVAYSFQATATDADNDPITYTIANRPAWATFNASTGLLQGTPGANHVRTYSNIVIGVTDGKAAVQLPAFAIAVAAANGAPVISGTPATTATVGTQYSFQPTATDADNNTLTFSITNRPTWATFNTSNGRLLGTPTAANLGAFANIGISVSDGQVTSALPAFTITVSAPPNAAPVISGTPATSTVVGTQYTFQPTATDADNNALTFSITNRPSWATFSTTTGRLQGTPAAANVGSFANIVISVSDGQASAALAAFAISVGAPANTAPTISGTPGTSAMVGTQYAFQPSATDAQNNALTFSITNRPTWATFNTATGRLSGTPGAANVGSFANIGISVSDGLASASLPAFSISVSPAPNVAPTISGTPATAVMQGTQYSFQPTAVDANGDVLTFSIVNKPAWATFSAATGRLEGTPGAANVGTTTGIVISVSDGALTSALAAFNVTVQAVAIGSATLSWTPPTQNTDGSALTDLAGFKIYWGTSQANLPNVVTINNPGITSYLVENLVAGTYFFAATAFDASGNESTRSNVASKTIQ